MPGIGSISMRITKDLRKHTIERLQEAADAAAIDTCIAIEADVKGGGPHAAPYRTGNLRRSYHVDYSRREEHIFSVGNDPHIAMYAIFVELGTRFMAARPHLVPALEAQRKNIMARIRKHLE